MLAAAAGTIADPQVRNRGTIGGSLAHGDPASDLPAVLLIAEGSVTVKGAGGERTIPAGDLFRDYLRDRGRSRRGDHRRCSMPALDGWGFGYQKFNRRSEDWAMVAVAAVVKRVDDVSEDVRVGLTNMGSVPLRASAVEDALRGQPPTAEAIASGRRAGRRGHRSAGRPERQRRLQAPPGAGADPAGAGGGGRVVMIGV